MSSVVRRYQVTHRTEYRYDAPVNSSYGQVVLSPRPRLGQRPLWATITIDPAPQTQHERIDHFGNRVSYFEVLEDHELLRIVSTSEVEVDSTDAMSFLADALNWEQARDLIAGSAASTTEDINATEFSLASPHVPMAASVAMYASQSFPSGRSLYETVGDLAARIHADFVFEPDATEVHTTLDEVLHKRAGVCQDFSHLMIASLRSVGLAARYVSGYLETLPPPGQVKLAGSDVSHAWVSVYFPNVGWLDIDPTNNLWVSDRHITTAWGRDYSDVAPVKGVIFSESTKNELTVSVDVVAIAG